MGLLNILDAICYNAKVDEYVVPNSISIDFWTTVPCSESLEGGLVYSYEDTMKTDDEKWWWKRERNHNYNPINWKADVIFLPEFFGTDKGSNYAKILCELFG